MPRKVFFVHDLTEPVLHHGGIDVVVVGPFFVARVVGRIDIDALDLPGVNGQKGLEGFEVVAVNDEVIVQADLVRERFILARYQLMVLDQQMVVLDKCLTLEIQRGHALVNS